MKKPITTSAAPRAKTEAETILGERLRIAAILESPVGLVNPKAARELALRSGMEPDSANAILGNLPPESPFLAAMQKETIGIAAGLTDADKLTATSASAAKKTRLAELQEAGAAVGAAKGYRAKTNANTVTA